MPRGNLQSQPFLKQVQVAVRRAGGNPNRIGRGPNPGGGRRETEAVGSMDGVVVQSSSRRFFVRGAMVVGSRTRAAASAHVASLSRRGSSSSMPQDGSGRSVVPAKAKAASKAVDAHLRYLERDGVNRDGREREGLFGS